MQERPTLSGDDRALVWEKLGPEIAEVEATFGLQLRSRWYGTPVT
jgi:hypothetical protein